MKSPLLRAMSAERLLLSSNKSILVFFVHVLIIASVTVALLVGTNNAKASQNDDYDYVEQLAMCEEELAEYLSSSSATGPVSMEIIEQKKAQINRLKYLIQTGTKEYQYVTVNYQADDFSEYSQGECLVYSMFWVIGAIFGCCCSIRAIFRVKNFFTITSRSQLLCNGSRTSTLGAGILTDFIVTTSPIIAAMIATSIRIAACGYKYFTCYLPSGVIYGSMHELLVATLFSTVVFGGLCYSISLFATISSRRYKVFLGIIKTLSALAILIIIGSIVDVIADNSSVMVSSIPVFGAGFYLSGFRAYQWHVHLVVGVVLIVALLCAAWRRWLRSDVC